MKQNQIILPKEILQKLEIEAHKLSSLKLDTNQSKEVLEFFSKRKTDDKKNHINQKINSL